MKLAIIVLVLSTVFLLVAMSLSCGDDGVPVGDAEYLPIPDSAELDQATKILKFRGKADTLYYLHDPIREVGIWYIRLGTGPAASISVLSDTEYNYK